MAEPTVLVSTAGDPVLRARGVWPTLRRRVSFWIPAVALFLLVVVALAPGWIGGFFGNPDPRVCDLARTVGRATSGHPFGFDRQGCDVYANVVHGTRNSLLVGFCATLLALAVALVVGTLAGLSDGWLDAVFARTTDVFLGFPFLLGALVVLISLGERSVWTVSLVLGIFSWPVMARLVRASVRSVRNSEFVLASQAMGIGTWRTVTRHVLPNSLGPVLAVATIAVGQIIVAESTLTYLGVGLQAPAISWGRQLADGQQQLSSAPHLLIWPGTFLAVTVLSLIWLGDVLRDALDPRQR